MTLKSDLRRQKLYDRSEDELQSLKEFRRDHIDAWCIWESKNNWMKRAIAAETFLESVGFRRCDVPACNCHKWHQTNGK